jgi:hypothetical protein
MILPDGKTAVSINFTGDNHGPHTAQQVKSIYDRLRKKYPGAEIFASTLNEVATELNATKSQLPVVTSEIGDTWIYGYASSPVMMAKFRALSRLYSDWIKNGKINPESDTAIDFAVRLGLVAEHTWGLDVTVWLKNWDITNVDIFNASRNRPDFLLMEESWKEKAANIDKAIALLPENLQIEAKAAINDIGTVAAKTMTKHDKAKEINKNGALISAHKDVKMIAGEVTYQTFSVDDYIAFLKAYCRNKFAIYPNQWFGNPKLENTQAQSASVTAQATQIAVGKQGKNKQIDCRLSFPDDTRIDKRMLPEQVGTQYIIQKDGSVEMTVSLINKPAVRLPEAWWVSFRPEEVVSVFAEKMGEKMDVLDVVEGGNRQMHSIDRYVDIVTTKGAIRITTLDAPLVVVGERNALNYSTTLPDLSKGIHFCLFNNLWGTNFTMWWEGSISYRFKIEYQSNVTPTYQLTEQGGLKYLHFENAGCDTVSFRADTYSGPSLFLNEKTLGLTVQKEGTFSGTTDELDYGLEYATEGGQFIIRASCRNRTSKDLTNLQFSLQLGINTAMKSYPEWRSVYFPTLMRCEQTHFWGYLMNPNGGIITVTSPDPVASYRLLYNNSQKIFSSGHLIQTVSLDLLNPSPLPAGHPLQADRLKKGETKTWTIYLGCAKELSEVIPAVSLLTKSSVITAETYTVADGEKVNLKVYGSHKPDITVTAPDGKKQSLSLSNLKSGVFQTTFQPAAGKGVYTLHAKNKNGKISEACVSVRYAWSDYIKGARRASLKYPQKASSHTESWYGFFPAYIAGEYFPEKETDAKVDDLFHEVFPLMYDTITSMPTSWQSRIQNHALAASLFAQRYKTKGDIADLRSAAGLSDFLITVQSNDGAYRNEKTHYTSVIYIAKAIMEVMAEEKKLAAGSDEWKENYKRHYYSVKKAIDELTANLDNIQTEGEQTYEDGMIACSYSQIALFALLQPEGSAEREKYIRAAEFMYRGHRCLSQHLIPDSRIHGASIRFWESQYDILTYPNFINSPHGWSAWRIYGLKYLYEATGKEEYLMDMMSALGSCAQLLNPATDNLNWAFVCDPYVKVKMYVEDELHQGKGIFKDTIVGKQYLPMISDWYRAPKDTWVSGYWGYDGGNCDNDVHEIFKCMGEVALTSAYFHLRPDNTCITWNCSVEKQADKWKVIPSESCVNKLYTNTDVITDNSISVLKHIK